MKAIDSPIGTVTFLGYLVCPDCARSKAREAGITLNKGLSNRAVYPGDTYSDEVCDFCGKKLAE